MKPFDSWDGTESDTPPENPVVAQTWIDTSKGVPGVRMVFNGSEWVELV